MERASTERSDIWNTKKYHFGILILTFCLIYFPLEYVYQSILSKASFVLWHPASGIALLFGIFAFPYSFPIILIAFLLNQIYIAGQSLSLELVVYAIFYSLAFTVVPIRLSRWLKINSDLHSVHDTTGIIMISIITASVLGIALWIKVFIGLSIGSVSILEYISSILMEFFGILSITYLFFLVGNLYKNIFPKKNQFSTGLLLIKKKLLRIPRGLILEIVGISIATIIGVILIESIENLEVLHIFLLFLLPILWTLIRFGRNGNAISIPAMVILVVITEQSMTLNFIENHEMQTVSSILLTLSIILGAIVSDQRIVNQQLRASKSKFDLLVGSAPIGICQIDDQLVVEYTNQMWLDLFAAEADDVIGKTIFEKILPVDRGPINSLLEQLIKENKTFEGPFRIITSKPDQIWLQGSFLISPDNSDHHQGILCLVTDISTVMHKDEEFKHNEEIMSALINGIPDPAWLKDKDGRYLAINNVMEKLFHRSRKDFIGKNDLEIWGEAQAELFMRTDETVIQTKEPLRFESPLSPEDDFLWFETVKSPIVMDGHVFGTTGISRDISDRRKVENALLESEHHLKGLLNNIPDLAWMKDKNKRYLAVNGVFYSILHAKPEDVVGKKSEEIFPLEISSMLDQEDDEVLFLGRPKVVEAVIVDETGYESWYETIKMPLFDEQSQVVGLTGVARDITARKRSEEAIQHRLDTEKLIAYVSTRLNELRISNIEEEINEIMESVGRFVNADRSYLIIFNENDQSVGHIYRWVENGIEDRKNAINGPEWKEFHWLQKRIEEMKPIRLNQVSDLPITAQRELEYALQADISSLLIIPVSLHENVCSSIYVAETVTRERSWTEAEEQFLKVINQMITTSIARLENAERVRQAETRYRMLVEQISAVVYIDSTDEYSSGIYMSPQIFELVGYTHIEMIDDPLLFWKIIHPEDKERVMRENTFTNQTGETFQVEYRLVAKNGGIVWVEDKAILFSDENGEKRWFGVIYNITHRKQIEEALFESEARFHELFDHSPIALWEEDLSKVKKHIDQLRRQGITDFKQYFKNHPKEIDTIMGQIDVLNVNQATLTLTRADSKRELIESYLSTRQLKPDDLFLDELIRLAEGETHFEVEGANDIIDGEIRYHHVQVMVVPGYETSFERVIIAITDVTERKTAEEQLVFLSTHDSLTGLYSRSYFETEIARLQTSRQYPISILMADVDYLKETNDKLGHAIGDKLIIEAARVLKMTFRPEDVVARYGGDEFVVLIPKTDQEAAERMVERLNHMISIENQAALQPVTLGLSIGIACAIQGVDLTDTLKEADKAMYQDKTRHHKGKIT